MTSNRQTTANSGEDYKSKDAVKKNAASATIEDKA